MKVEVRYFGTDEVLGWVEWDGGTLLWSAVEEIDELVELRRKLRRDAGVIEAMIGRIKRNLVGVVVEE